MFEHVVSLDPRYHATRQEHGENTLNTASTTNLIDLQAALDALCFRNTGTSDSILYVPHYVAPLVDR